MAWVQTARPRNEAAFAEVARAASFAPDGYWAHPEAGLRMSAQGVADIREGASLRSVLSALEVPPGLPATLPGPWFGAAIFSGPPGGDWSGFPPLRFTLPS